MCGVATGGRRQRTQARLGAPMLEQGQGHGEREPTRGIALAGVWPQIERLVPAEDRELAARILVAPAITSDGETLSELLTQAAPTSFDFVVAEGVVLKETMLGARAALELLLTGDVLAPPLTASRQVESRATSRYIAHGPALIAVLDERFRQAARRWPGLSDLLHDRLGQQAHRASMHLATLHQPRVGDRILSLFVDLAERLGRVTADGITIDVPLTHQALGRLVGAQRPTVSIAMAELAAAGTLVRRETGSWRLDGDALGRVVADGARG